MCKLLLMTGIEDSKLAKEFMRLMSYPMSRTNNHGIGYTAVKSNGDIFAERWLYNSMFLDYSKIMTKEVAEELFPYIDRLPDGALDDNYSVHGEIDYNDMKTITMHTRFATCGREFRNTHPFIDQDVSLVHNGVIRNADTLKLNKISSCDSEAGLQSYINTGVVNDSGKAKDWLDILSGSYAFGVLSRNNDGNRILDVVRGSSFLYYMEIPGLGKIFTTDNDDAIAVVKEMGLEFTKAPTLVDYNTMYRYNAVTGEFIEQPKIKTEYKWEGYTGNSNYYQHGRSSSSYSNPTKNKSTQGKGSEDQVPKLALIHNREELDDMEYPNLMDKKGNWDFSLVSKYLNDLNEPFLDRLDIFDLVHNRDVADLYEMLEPAQQEYCRDMDIMQGFKAARRLVVELEKERRGKFVD